MQKGREGGREDRRALYKDGGGGTGQVAKCKGLPENQREHRRARGAARGAAETVEARWLAGPQHALTPLKPSQPRTPTRWRRSSLRSDKAPNGLETQNN